MKVHGWKVFIIFENLKALKVVLKTWNREVFGKLDSQIISPREEVSKVDSLEVFGTLSREDIDSKSKSLADL